MSELGLPVARSPVAEHKAHAPARIRCVVCTVSDSKTPETDTSGRLIRELLLAGGHEVVDYQVVRDEPSQVHGVIHRGCTHPGVQAIIFTGGTGITTRDQTFEAIDALLEKRLPGFGELFRQLSYQEIGSAEGLWPGKWEERTGERFEIDSRAGWLRAAIDGEPERLDTPIEFTVEPQALPVLVPKG